MKRYAAVTVLLGLCLGACNQDILGLDSDQFPAESVDLAMVANAHDLAQVDLKQMIDQATVDLGTTTDLIATNDLAHSVDQSESADLGSVDSNPIPIDLGEDDLVVNSDLGPSADLSEDDLAKTDLAHIIVIVPTVDLAKNMDLANTPDLGVSPDLATTDLALVTDLGLRADLASSDTTPPMITVLGDNPMEVIINSTYVDPGATATDLVDGPVTVTTKSYVDTTSVGSYTVVYVATDAAGNMATASRTVNVVWPYCGTVTMNSVQTNARARLTVQWANDTPQGPATPSFSQAVAKVTIRADGGMYCEDVSLTSLTFKFYATFVLGGYELREGSSGGPVITNGNQTPAASTLTVYLNLQQGTYVPAGSSKTFLLFVGTQNALPNDSLSVRVEEPIEYQSLWSGVNYSVSDDLPLVFKTMTY